jgi:hypothetical protein
MQSMAVRIVVACSVLACAVPLRAEPAQDPLSPLRALAGRWEGTTSTARRLAISYKSIANDSVVVETWRSPSGRETMTVYHMDGSKVIATHYCAQGNQPRLKLVGSGAAGRMHFLFQDATNLASEEASHLHEFWIERTGAETMKRSETYREKGEADEEIAVLTRVAPASSPD